MRDATLFVVEYGGRLCKIVSIQQQQQQQQTNPSIALRKLRLLGVLLARNRDTRIGNDAMGWVSW
jgi:hypothetical protein